MNINAVVTKLHSPDTQNQLWTIISAGIFAIFPMLMMLIATRLVGLSFAGLLAHAAALSVLPRLVSLFAVRGYQNIDVKREFSFNNYLGLRTISASVSSLFFIIFLVVTGFEILHLLIILLFYFLYLVDVYADVFMGDLQQKGKMRIAGKMQASSFCAVLLAFSIIMFITQTILLALAIAGLVVFCSYIVWIWIYRDHFGAIRVKVDFSTIKKLAWAVLPLLIYGFIVSYLENAQKYYLSAFFSDDAVAIYAILMLPVSLLNLACVSFFLGAITTKTAVILADGQLNRFIKRINIQLLFAVGLFIPFILCVYFFGIPLLSWIYAVDLSPYQKQLMILSFGGIVRAPIFVLAPVLVILRKQKMLLYSVIFVALISGPLMWWLVLQYGISGAVFSNLVIYAPQAVIFYVAYHVALRGHKRDFK